MATKTNFDQITASLDALAAFLSSLPTLKGPWDEAFDKVFCSTCGVQDCNAEGCPYQRIRAAAVSWWLGLEVKSNGGDHSGG